MGGRKGNTCRFESCRLQIAAEKRSVEPGKPLNDAQPAGCRKRSVRTLVPGPVKSENKNRVSVRPQGVGRQDVGRAIVPGAGSTPDTLKASDAGDMEGRSLSFLIGFDSRCWQSA